MPDGWTDGAIRRPVKQWVPLGEFSDLFGVPDDFIEAQIAAGVLPQPKRYNRQKVHFHWTVAVYFDLWLQIFPQSEPGTVKEKASGKLG